MANLVLTSKRVSPSKGDLTTPLMSLLQTEQIVKVKGFKKGVSIIYGTSARPFKKYRMAETPDEFDHASKLANGLTTTANGTLNIAASGTTQATALPVGGITAYQNVVTGATGGSQAGVLLPPASTKFNNGGAFVVKNITAVALSVYPSTSETINGLAVNAPIQVPAFGRAHFYASASGAWKGATAYE